MEIVLALVSGLAGAVGAVAAVIAVCVSFWQVRRDRERERWQAIARAKSAKLLMGAFYASAVLEVRYLVTLLSEAGETGIGAMEQAARLRDDQHLAIIFQALLTIDSANLTSSALMPVGDAQTALVAWHNVITGLAAGRQNREAKKRLPSLMEEIKSAYERMRGEVPFEIEQ